MMVYPSYEMRFSGTCFSNDGNKGVIRAVISVQFIFKRFENSLFRRFKCSTLRLLEGDLAVGCQKYGVFVESEIANVGKEGFLDQTRIPAAEVLEGSS
jgi:hypothetical protein